MPSISVTAKPCKCGLIERFAKYPENPIKYDRETKEYYFSYSGGRLVIRHCFFCGGKAPASLRSSLFAVIPEKEKTRLHELTKNIKSLKDATKVLGKPSFESCVMDTDITPRKKEKAEETQSFKSFVYNNLSETADIMITDYRTQDVKVAFLAKSLKKMKKEA